MVEYIATIAEQNEHIMALIAVGSGSYGYNDEFSDIDMVIAIDNDANSDLVMNDVSASIGKQMKLIYFKQASQIRMQVYVGENYLEIDIGYGVYTGAAAMRKDWKVLFDKTGTVDAAMRRSWEARQQLPRTAEYRKKLAECADTVWHRLMQAAVAIKRGQPFRAIGELSSARDLYIGLLGCRYGIEIGRGKDMDQLPEAELAVLQKTLVTDLSKEMLWQSLAALIDAVYAELESHGEDSLISIGRRQINEYVAEVKNA